MAPTATVNLIGSAAPLLGAPILSDCQSAEDPSCQGGVAAVAALARHHASNENAVIIPRLDRQSEFVQSHPLWWNVNTAVIHEHFQWNVVTSHPSLLAEGSSQIGTNGEDSNNNSPIRTTNYPDNESTKLQQQRQPRDVNGLQTPSMPLLMTNVAPPPSNSWHPYVESVHFDNGTKLALIALEEELTVTGSSDAAMTWSQVESAWSSLDYIAAENYRQNCGETITTDAPIDQVIQQGTAGQEMRVKCWIPVIMVYKSRSPESFDRLVSTVSEHEKPPALIVDWEGAQKAYTTPKVNSQNVWTVSQELSGENYVQLQITMDNTTDRINDLIILKEDLKSLPAELKDEKYASDIQFLRTLADEAIAHDPILGNSNAMPRADTGQCLKEECEIGNLLADSLRWWQPASTNAAADVAFLLGDSLTGPGWSFGQVRVSDIWKTVTKPTTICTGKVSGFSLLRALDQALRTGETEQGGNASATMNPMNATENTWQSQFLQVSGLQVVYGSHLPANPTRLVSVKIWDKNERAFLHLNPLRLYQFMTQGVLCDETKSSFASLLRGDDDSKATIENTLLQTIVGEYLHQLGTTYVPLLESRLIETDDDTTAPLDFASTTGACPEGTYWEGQSSLCQSCPDIRSHVTISDNRANFEFQNNTIVPQTGRVVISNRDLHDYRLVSRNLPPWFEFIETDSLSSSPPRSSMVPSDASLRIASGDRIAIDYAINTSKVGVGVTFQTIFFNISDYVSIPACFSDPFALELDTLLQVTPPTTTVDLGAHAIVGLVLMSLVFLGCLGMSIWVFLERERWGYGKVGDKSLRNIQPLYLVTICFGVLVMASTILVLSLDKSGSKLCLVAPWVFSLGLTMTFSALIAKLKTATRVIVEKPNERTIQMAAKDLFIPFAILFTINFGILLVMLVDPPTLGQQTVDGEEWKVYGFCGYSDLSASLVVTSGFVQLSTLFYTCYQAYRVISMNEEFHELKNITVSLFIWFQIVVIAIPTWFAINEGSFVGQYYFKVVTICALCLSMLLCIFVPVVTKKVNPSEFQPYPVEREEDQPTMFGGFLGFTGNTINSRAIGSNRINTAELDEETQHEEQNRCLADRFCY